MVQIAAMSVVAMRAEQCAVRENCVRFDTDSAPIGIDNRCTGCISHKIEDFVGPLIDSNRSIKGFGGSRVEHIKIGTIKWQWEDDLGKVTTFLIPKSFYVPQGKVRLLSPQHWAQAQKDYKPVQGTGETTLGNNVTLFWNQRKSTWRS